MITSSGSASSSTRGSSSVVPSTLRPAIAHALLARVVVHEADRRRATARGCGAARRRPAGRRCRRRRSAPRARPAASERAAQSGARRAARTRKREPPTSASVSRKSSAITPRGGSVLPGESRNSAAISTKLETTTALSDRLEVLLVDEAPELRVEAEGGEDRQLHQRPRRRSCPRAASRSGAGSRCRSAGRRPGSRRARSGTRRRRPDPGAVRLRKRRGTSSE